jgi:uncharacterized protein involved in type VI secretion and phage assembly
MTAHEMVQTIQRIARHEAAQVWAPALGVVTSQHVGDDKPDSACTVRLRESDIVLPRVPVATGLVGAVATPDVGDLVVVLFLGGDLHAPVIVGRLYHRDLYPPNHETGDLVAWLPQAKDAEDETLRVTVKTPDGGPRSMELKIGGDPEVVVTVDEERIELKTGETQLTLSQSSSSDGKAELKVAGSSVVVKQGGDVTITAEGKLELKGNEVSITGESKVKVSGQMIDLN